MPWRTIAKTEQDINRRIYAVWVSEVMLQQTQVSTVVPYYNSWLQRWPTVQALASAQLDEVHRCWAGLGYYSRATRLHQGAQTIVSGHDGVFPTTAAGLAATVPGVGRYTAAAVASIAAGEPTAVLDGNVARVMARMRGVGADTNEKRTQDHFWRLSGDVLDPTRPGDSNQALMELGATVCTPKKVRCDVCPVQNLCYAFEKSSLIKPSSENTNKENAAAGARNSSLLDHFSMKSKVKSVNKSLSENEVCGDIENVPSCHLCLPQGSWDTDAGVTNFPRKAAKASSRRQVTVVLVLAKGRETANGTSEEEDELLVLQRPKTGLLANLWELVSVPLAQSPSDDTVSPDQSKSKLQNGQAKCSTTNSNPDFPYNELRDSYCISEGNLTDVRYVDDVVHIFSHIHQTYRVFSGRLKPSAPLPPVPDSHQAVDFLTRAEFAKAAISTAMKKVLKAVDTQEKKAKVERDNPKAQLKQTTLGQFFLKKR